MNLIPRWATLLLLIAVIDNTARATEIYAPFQPTMKVGAAYTIAAAKLHPTQFAVGFREVAYKMKTIDAKNAAELRAYLEDKDVPVVIGPGGRPYMTDGHHTIRALLDSHQTDKTVYGHILANWAELDEAVFWAQMQTHHYTYLMDQDGRGPLAPSLLPTTLTEIQSNIYRGLGWAVMKAGGFVEKKGPDGFFQEFYWGEYFRAKVRWNDADDNDFKRAVNVAVALAHEPAAAKLPGYTALTQHP
ncbi:MAG: chromosome partitioning protein ParB [Opitutaceae bacterium]|nr:chromosome partitioning protein ParB [Opitutaceae bacterium]